MAKKTHAEFEAQVLEKGNGEYELLTPYAGTDTKVTFQHLVCGFEYDATPAKFLQGRRCPRCSKRERKTPERFEEEVLAIHGDSYRVLTPYQTSKTKVRMKHLSCGTEWEVTPSNLLKGRTCPTCAMISRQQKLRTPPDAFLEQIQLLENDAYTFLNPYVNAHTQLRVRHNECGYEYWVRPGNFLSGKRCPQCQGLLKKTTEGFQTEIQALVGDEYQLRSAYLNARTKVTMEHQICQQTYEVTPNNFLRGYRCPHCFKNELKPHEQFIAEVFALVGDEYEVMGTYVTSKVKIKLLHRACGRTFDVLPNGFLSGSRCSHCFKRNEQKTHEQFVAEVEALVGEEYEVIGTYQKSQIKIKMLHHLCGQTYEVMPNSFLQGTRCPYCAQSKGEVAVAKYLDRLGIHYQRQVSFEACRSIRPLPFDFGLYHADGTLMGLIEYDGIQHFHPVEYFKGEAGLRSTQQRDQLKTQFAKSNGIPLLRIPYFQLENLDARIELWLKTFTS